jgi:hypothetical protein
MLRWVTGGHLLVCGKNVYNQFEDCKDSGFYISDDEITGVIALPIEKVSIYFELISLDSFRVIN